MAKLGSLIFVQLSLSCDTQTGLEIFLPRLDSKGRIQTPEILSHDGKQTPRPFNWSKYDISVQ